MVQTALKRFLKEHNYEAGYTDLFFTLYNDIQSDVCMPLEEKTDILQRLYDVSELLFKYES